MLECVWMQNYIHNAQSHSTYLLFRQRQNLQIIQKTFQLSREEIEMPTQSKKFNENGKKLKIKCIEAIPCERVQIKDF